MPKSKTAQEGGTAHIEYDYLGSTHSEITVRCIHKAFAQEMPNFKAELFLINTSNISLESTRFTLSLHF